MLVDVNPKVYEQQSAEAEAHMDYLEAENERLRWALKVALDVLVLDGGYLSLEKTLRTALDKETEE